MQRANRWALIALVSGLALGIGAGTSSAVAYLDYCGVLVPAKTACAEGVRGVFIINQASYPGAGTVAVCERVITSAGTVSRRCNGRDNIVTSERDLNPYYGVQMGGTAGNDSAWTHTINGRVWIP